MPIIFTNPPSRGGVSDSDLEAGAGISIVGAIINVDVDDLTIGISDDELYVISSGISHSDLKDLLNDDHPQYIPTNASRGFTSTVSGIDPTENYHLATKYYVDQTAISGVNLNHGDLAGLLDDDHTQYLLRDDFTVYSGSLQNQIDGKAASSHIHDDRYYTENEVDSISGVIISQIITDHGDLTGLADDDHIQYVLVDGSRGFTSTVSGVDPAENYHLTTKKYVDGVLDVAISGADEFIELVDTPVDYNENSLLISSDEGIEYIPTSTLTVSGSNVSIGNSSVNNFRKLDVRHDVPEINNDYRAMNTFSTASGNLYDYTGVIGTRNEIDLGKVTVSGMSYGYGPWIQGTYNSVYTSQGDIDLDVNYAMLCGVRADAYYQSVGNAPGLEVFGAKFEGCTGSVSSGSVSWLCGTDVRAKHLGVGGVVDISIGSFIDSRNNSDHGVIEDMYGILNQTVDHGQVGSDSITGYYSWCGLYTGIDYGHPYVEDIYGIRVQPVCGYNPGYYPNATASSTNVYAIKASLGTRGANSNIVNGYYLYLPNSPDLIGDNSGNIENLYGIYVEDLGGAGEETYTIYSESLAPSYFAGDISIGSTTSSGKLRIDGDVNVTSSGNVYIEGKLGVGIEPSLYSTQIKGRIVAGYEQNVISGSENSSILGGGNNSYGYNLIESGQDLSVIAAGAGNVIRSPTIIGQMNFIGAGFNNVIKGTLAFCSSVVGGQSNKIEGAGQENFIGGGYQNVISDATQGRDVICGGSTNEVIGDGYGSILGGQLNVAGHYASVVGGAVNKALANYGVVLGGSYNTADGHHSFSSGYHAKANHDGSFVWSDYSSADTFVSEVNNEFALRVNGGMRVVVSGSGDILRVYDGPTIAFHVESDGTLSTDVSNYENLVTDNNDIPNKKYVDDVLDVAISGANEFIELNDTPNGYNEYSLLVSSGTGIGYVSKNVLSVSGSEVSIGSTIVEDDYKLSVRNSTVRITSSGSNWNEIWAEVDNDLRVNSPGKVGINITQDYYGVENSTFVVSNQDGNLGSTINSLGAIGATAMNNSKEYVDAVAVLARAQSNNLITKGISALVDNAVTGSTGDLVGVSCTVADNLSQAADKVVCYEASAVWASKGYGFYVNDFAITTKKYGLYVEDLGAGHYSIFSEGGKNYFGGDVLFGATTSGSTPTENYHLTTKKYVDDEITTTTGLFTQFFMVDGSRELAGHLLPEMTGSSGDVSTRDIGSNTQKFRNLYVHDAYIDSGSLYVDGKKVVDTSGDTIVVSTDPNQDLLVQTTSNGTLRLESEDEINLEAAGGVEFNVPSDLAAKHMNFTNYSANGNITFIGNGLNSQVQFLAIDEIDLSAPVLDMNGNATLSGTLLVGDIPHVNLDTDKFLVSNGGSIKYRTGEEVLSDIEGITVSEVTTISGDITSQIISEFIELTDTPDSYNENSLLISSSDGVDYIPKDILTVSGGNIGIGVTTPNYPLHVNTISVSGVEDIGLYTRYNPNIDRGSTVKGRYNFVYNDTVISGVGENSSYYADHTSIKINDWDVSTIKGVLCTAKNFGAGRVLGTDVGESITGGYFRGISNSTQDIDNAVGVYGEAHADSWDWEESESISNPGTLSKAYGVYGIAGSQGAPLTNSYSLYAAASFANYGGSVTNAYGLYVESQTEGSNNNYALYTAGGDVYFGGVSQLIVNDGSTNVFEVESNGTISTDTANYENLVTHGNDIPNKKYVDDAILTISGGGGVTVDRFKYNQPLTLVSGSLYTLPDVPVSGTVSVYLNGLMQEPGEDYTINSDEVTFLLEVYVDDIKLSNYIT